VQRSYCWKRETEGSHCYAEQKIDAMHITYISNEDALCLEIIQDKIKFFAMSMYIDIEEQIENIFTKIDQILQFVKGQRILIDTDSNSRSKTWHAEIRNTRGKIGGIHASRHLHIINEQSETVTFHNRGGSSKIDLTIANKRIADVHECEISELEIFSDHNFPKFKVGKHNSYENKYQCIRYMIK